ncbi:Tm-1-like ATP-binding domain-containing protein [Laceyella putida]|uniref:Tm-1-like ATP-binding domain-containing protein n=2 Tax=Laceyella putida TaxID=110101 RepID=A0ABW2RG17_9BACL
MGKTIALIGALDTKGADYAFVKREIEKRGHYALTINTGVLGEPLFEPDVPAERVSLAGGMTLDELRREKDKSLAMSVMTRGIAKVVKELFDQGLIDGGLSMGGSNGTMIGTSGLRALPVGVPKVMVSTVASGDTQPYVGISDIVMVPSILDVAGLNRISAKIYANAVGIIVGMVESEVPPIETKPLITASMFGNTTKLINQCATQLEENGYEVLVFHATGTGGKTMESLIDQGYITGVLDVTTTELADELVGGVLSAGPTRMEAAAKWALPQVIAPGCLDMVNFWGMSTVPDKYRDRLLYCWNDNITLMRTTPEENAKLGRLLAEKANRSKGEVAIFLPLQGLSELDAPGREFWWPEADQALFDAIRQYARKDISIYELDCNINDAMFAQAVTSKLLDMLQHEYE